MQSAFISDFVLELVRTCRRRLRRRDGGGAHRRRARRLVHRPRAAVGGEPRAANMV